MYTITVQMINGKGEYVNREIDGSNFELENARYNVELQSKILKEWIQDRAIQQHNDTSLKLVCWYVH